MKSYSSFKVLICAVFTFLICAVYAPKQSAAQDIYALTGENIRAFVEQTSKVTSGTNEEMSFDEKHEYLERHLHPKARFKSKLIYNIPGFPPTEKSLALNKEEFIQNIEAGDKAMENYEHSITVREIKISSDKTKATVFTNGREEGLMNMNGEKVPIIGDASCNQILMLDDGVIQMYNANCKTSIMFQEF